LKRSRRAGVSTSSAGCRPAPCLLIRMPRSGEEMAFLPGSRILAACHQGACRSMHGSKTWQAPWCTEHGVRTRRMRRTRSFGRPPRASGGPLSSCMNTGPENEPTRAHLCKPRS
jgi:hypothetical protein